MVLSIGNEDSSYIVQGLQSQAGKVSEFGKLLEAPLGV